MQKMIEWAIEKDNEKFQAHSLLYMLFILIMGQFQKDNELTMYHGSSLILGAYAN